MAAPTFNTEPLAALSPEDQLLFQQFGAGPVAPVPFSCLHHAFEHHARISPNTVAIEHLSASTSITYSALDAQANRLAHRLRALNISRGCRVVILARRSIANATAVLAILKAGAQYVPLDGVTVTDATLDHVLRDSGAKLVLYMDEYRDRFDGVPGLCLEDAIREDEESGADLSKPEDASVGSDGIYVIYTSGTTGQPKGVDVMHSGITNFLLQSPGNVSMRPGLRVAQLLNIAFDMGAWELLGSLSNGCTLCLRGNTSGEWKALLKTVDIVISTPSILSRHDPADYPTIKHVIVGGEVCPQELADRWARYTQFNNCCGPTEISIANTVQPHTPGVRLSIGTPVPNTTLYVLDDDAQPCPIGTMGSMWVGGAGVSRGYLNLPDKTAERYRPDPFLGGDARMFNTGDLGRWRPDGQLDHLGRADDQVKVKGFRVELDGVAAAMRSCEYVQAAVALLVGSELWGFVTPASAPSEAVRAATALLQPYYAVPTRILSLPDFPQTRNGKVDKRALRDLAESTPPLYASSSRSRSADSVPNTPAFETPLPSWPSSPASSVGPATPSVPSTATFAFLAHPASSPRKRAALPWGLASLRRFLRTEAR